MKALILSVLLLAGCATVQEGSSTIDYEARDLWLHHEMMRIQEKRIVVDDMLRAGQISYQEYFDLMEQCDEEKRTILDRLPAEFR